MGFLDDLFVEPAYRGQKIAQKLIGHLKSLSKAIILVLIYMNLKMIKLC